MNTKTIISVILIALYGANIRATNAQGQSLLHIAILNSSLATVEWALDQGVPIDGQDNNGITPLHLSILEDEFEITEYLLQREANPNIPNNMGIYPLHYAAMIGYTYKVKALLESGANPEVFTNQKQSAEDFASNNEIKDLIKDFIKNAVPAIEEPDS